MQKIIIVTILSMFGLVTNAQKVDTADLEIWGLRAGMTKPGFVKQLNDRKGHICMADIRPMGYPSANVIGMDHIYLVTLREAPVNPRRNALYAKEYNAALAKSGRVSMAPDHSMDMQLAVKNVFVKMAGDTATENLNLSNAGVTDRMAYDKAMRRLSGGSPFTAEECLGLLYHSPVDSIKEFALLHYLAHIKTNRDALRLLPVVTDRDVDLLTVNLLRNYFAYHHLTASELDQSCDDIIFGFNATNPTVAMLLAQVLMQQDVPGTIRKRIAAAALTSFTEMEAGSHADMDFYKAKATAFRRWLAK